MCLGLEVNAPQLPTAKSGNGTQDTWNLPSLLPLRDYHPLRWGIPAHFGSEG